MGVKGEMGVKGDTQDTEGPVERQRGNLEGEPAGVGEIAWYQG